MPSKKYTAQKREEIRQKKQKHDKPSMLKPFLILIVVLVVITAVIWAGLNFLGADDTEVVVDENSEPTLEKDYIVLGINSTSNIIDVLANDIDADNDVLNITETSDPSNGVAEIIDNKIVYTPNDNFSGVDTFSYKVSDGEDEVYSTVNIVVADEYPIATIDTSKGTIMLELYDDEAPKTCENFIKLANDGFYDGMIFHRVMDDFMIQAGNTYPDGTTKESPYGNIEEFEGTLSHLDGSISMASTGAGVPGSAQFFICDGDQPGLDGNYAVFGKTIVGMIVVRDIADEPQDGSYGEVGGGKPYTNVLINSITISNQ